MSIVKSHGDRNFFLQGPTGKTVRLLYEESRTPEHGDLDRIFAEFRIDVTEFACADALSENDEEAKRRGEPVWTELFVAYVHDSYDGRHELVLEDRALNEHMLAAALLFLHASHIDPMDVFDELAERSPIPKVFKKAIEEEPVRPLLKQAIWG